MSRVRPYACLVGLLFFSSYSEAGEFCAVDSFGNRGACFSALTMCQSWVETSGGTCAYRESASSQNSLQGDGLRDGAILSDLIRALIGERANSPTVNSDEFSRATESYRAQLEEDERKKVQISIELGCKGGTEMSLPIAEWWSRRRMEIDKRLASVKNAADRKRLVATYDAETSSLLQQHLDNVYSLRKRRATELSSSISRYQGADRASRYQNLELLFKVESLVYQHSALIGFSNPNVSPIRLERLLLEGCETTMLR